MYVWRGAQLNKRSRGQLASDQSRALEAAAQGPSGFYPRILLSSHGGSFKLSRKAEGRTWAKVQEKRQAPELDHSGCLSQVLLLPRVAPWGPRAIPG